MLSRSLAQARRVAGTLGAVSDAVIIFSRRLQRTTAPLSQRLRRWALIAALAVSVAPPYAAAQVSHRCRGGESVWLIAAAYSIPVWRLIVHSQDSLSHLRSLPAGTVIEVPGATQPVEVPRASEVQRRQEVRARALSREKGRGVYLLGLGETLFDVASEVDVPVASLMQENHLEDPDLLTLSFEQPIVLPEKKPARVRQPGARPPRGVLHTLKDGESLWDVAATYQIGLAEILSSNRLSEADAERLDPGERVFVPGVSNSAAGDPTRRSSRAQRRAQKLAAKLGLGDAATAASLYHGRVKEAWLHDLGPPELLSGTLLWPVNHGHFVRGYGSGKGHYHLALDIAAHIGSKVRAAAPGMVAFAGRSIEGYGNMVLLLHPGGFATMYAHNSAVHVFAGEQVDRGAVIAEVGSTGLSKGPHVHFELLFNGRNCDPTHLLRPGVRERSGSWETPSPQVTWRPPEPRPDAVACHDRRHYPKQNSVAEEEIPH